MDRTLHSAVSAARSRAAVCAALLLLPLGVADVVPGTKLWEYAVGSPVVGCPAIGANGAVCVGALDGKVHALNGGTGAKLWEYATGSAIRASPSIHEDGTLYVGVAGGGLSALNSATGELLWTAQLGAGIETSPAIGSTGIVYVGTQGRQIVAVSAAGEVLWSFDTGGWVKSSPVIAPDGTVYAGCHDGKLYALEGGTGTKLWEFAAGGYVWSSPAIAADGTLYFGSGDHKVYALDPATGLERWEFLTGGEVTCSPAIGIYGTVYIGSWDSGVYALEGVAGEMRWEFAASDIVHSSPAVGADGTVYIGSNDKRLYALDWITGAKLWEFAAGAGVNSSPAIGPDGTVYFGADDGVVYAIKGNSGGGLGLTPWPKFHQGVGNAGRFQGVPTPPSIIVQPTSQAAPLGGDAFFSVTAEGTPPLRYQWRKDGINLSDGGRISGATTAQLTIANVEPADAAGYSVQVTNSVGIALSDAAVLVVGATDGGTIYLNNRVLADGIDAPIYLDVIGGAGLAGTNYAVQLFGGPVGTAEDGLLPAGTVCHFEQGAMAGYIDVPGVCILTSVAAGQEALVQLRAWDMSAGATYGEAFATDGRTGKSAVLRITTGGGGDPPAIPAAMTGLESFAIVPVNPLVIEPPRSQVAPAGANVTLTVIATGLDPLAYQWKLNNQPLSGATNASLALTSVSFANAGTYTVTVTNPRGSATSDAAILQVYYGDGRLDRWFYAGFDYTGIPGTNLADLTNDASFPLFPSALEQMTNGLAGKTGVGSDYGSFIQGFIVPPQAGAYVFWVASDDAAGLWLSDSESTNRIALVALCSEAVAQGDWFARAEQRSDPVTLEAGRRYYFEVLHKQGGGPDHVAAAWQRPDGAFEEPIPAAYLSSCLLPATAPVIRAQPQSLSVTAGEEAILSVTADGIPPLEYQWAKDGNAVPGATSARLVLSSVQPADGGAYTVTVRNQFGEATSEAASITVLCSLTVIIKPGGGVNWNPDQTLYPAGAVVALLATPDPGFAFDGWTGDMTSSENPLTVTMDRHLTITVSFVRVWTFELDAGVGGRAFKEPDAPEYRDGSIVQARAEPDAGYVFTGWTGDLTGTDNPLTLTMNRNWSLRAGFVRTRVLSTAAWGMGSVQADPPATNYLDGTVVNLTARADTGWQFVEWMGDLTGAQNPAALTMDGDKRVTAVFKQLFTVGASVIGQGVVTLDPALPQYLDGATVTVTATAAAGHRFTGWSGDLSGTVNPTTLTVNGNKSLTATFKPLWALTILQTQGGRIARNPEEPVYIDGTTVTATALPDADFIFKSWSGDLAGSQNPAAILMNGNKSVGASFARTYALAVTTDGSGSVRLDPAKDRYEAGEAVQLTAQPASGYGFAGWAGALSGTNMTAQLVMDGNKQVTARFLRWVTLTTGVIGRGSVDKTPVGPVYLLGASVTVTAHASDGWQFVGWTGALTNAQNPATLVVDADRQLIATFKRLFTVTTATNGVGAIVLDPDQPRYVDGATITVTASEPSGHRFVGWSGDLSGTQNPTTLLVNANKHIVASFLPLWTVTVEATAGGSVSKDPDSSRYLDGTTVRLSATPSPGFAFDSWSGDASGTANPLIVTVNRDLRVTAAFRHLYSITKSVEGRGSITLSPQQDRYLEGTTVTATAVPAAGEKFTGWSGDLSGTNNPVVFVVDSEKAITAHFLRGWTLSVAGGSGGLVQRDPDLAEYPDSSEVMLWAVPIEGFAFVSWAGDLVSTNNPATIRMNGNKSVQATFTRVWTLTATATGGIVNRNPDAVRYVDGTQVSLTAVAEAGYLFTGWTGDAQGTNATTTVIMTANRTVRANFTRLWTLTTTGSGGGRVTRDPDLGQYLDGTTVRLTAVPDSGRQFTSWSGDASGTNNPLTVTVSRAMSITANFTLTNLAAPSFDVSRLRLDADGLHLVITGQPNTQYELQASSNLRTWTTLAILSSADGTLQFTDPAPASIPRRVYRVKQAQ